MFIYSFFRSFFFGSFFVVFFSFSSSAFSSSYVHIDINNSKVSSIVPLISSVSGSSFTFTPDVSSTTIFLESYGDVSVDVFISQFYDSLSASGLSIMSTDSGLNVIYSSDNERFSGLSESLVLAYFYVPSSSTLVDGIEPFLTSSGVVSSMGDNLLIVRDEGLIVESISGFIESYKKSVQVPSSTVYFKYDDIDPSDFSSVDDVKIVFFESSNYLMISGNPDLVSYYEKMIKDIDSLSESYNVEILISSVSDSFIDSYDLSSLFRFGSFSLTLSSFGFDSSSGADSMSFLASFIQSDSRNKVLSRPFLMARTGVNSSFSSGSDLPFLVSIIDQDTGQSIRNVERRNVGLSFDFTIQTRKDGTRFMVFNQSLSSVSNQSVDGSVDVVLNSQTLNTVLDFELGELVAVGGISNNSERSSSSKFDVFDFGIPISNVDSSSSDNLVIFIRVTLI